MVVNIQHLVQEEKKAEQSTASFFAPTVDSEEVLEEEVAGEEFEFGAPNDECMVEEEAWEEYQAAAVIDAEEKTADKKLVVDGAPAQPIDPPPGGLQGCPRRLLGAPGKSLGPGAWCWKLQLPYTWRIQLPCNRSWAPVPRGHLVRGAGGTPAPPQLSYWRRRSAS